MNIQELAVKKELIKIEITDEVIVTKYGQPVAFWIQNHIGLDTYFEINKAQAANKGSALEAILNELILNEEGNAAIPEGKPNDIAMAALVKINEHLGK